MAKDNKDCKDFGKKFGNPRGFGKRKGAGRKGGRKNPDLDEGKEHRPSSITDEHFNDPSWYITNSATAEAVASFPFGRPIGYPVNMGRGLSYPTWPAQPNDPRHALPGIVAFQWYPAIGDASSPASPVNMAAQGIYTTVRGKNSGAKNYEPSDIMMYLLAMDSIYTMYAVGRRLYGTLHMYSVRNRYLPKLIVEAQGFSYEDVKGRAAQIKGFLDIIRARINQMAVPSHLTYFTRHFMLSSEVFSDREIIKSAVYIPIPHFVWKYSGYTDRKGGELLPQAWSGGATWPDHTWEEYEDLMEDLVQRVTTDVDTGIISGDILKAYENNLYDLPVVDFGYDVQPRYDSWMLAQIHNAVLNNDPIFTMHEDDTPLTYIKQDTPDDPTEGNRIITQYVHETSWPGSALDEALIDCDVDQPTPEHFIEFTRFVTTQAPYPDLDAHRVLNSGSEIATVCKLYRLDVENDSVFTYGVHSFLRLGLNNPDLAYAGLRALADISSVDAFPMIVVSALKEQGGSIDYVGTFGVTGNPTNISGDNLLAINNMAFMKLLV